MLQVEEAALDSAREARQALMEDLLGVSDGLGCVVPHDLAMQILSWLVVPLLELLAKISSGVSGRTRTALSSLFSTQDVQALIRWTIEVDLASKTSKGGLIPAVTVREKEIERISPQGVKEVKRCLARALTGLWL